jgi:hypothetical protein
MIFKHKIINGVQFLQRDSKVKTNIFLGQTFHIPHDGDCKPEMECELSPILKISVNETSVIALTKNSAFTFAGVTICTVYERKE